MFKHYLTTALRHFRRHKVTTGINVICMTVGLVVLLGIYGLVTYLSSGDRQYPNADRTYVITMRKNASISSYFSAWQTANYLKPDFPELETVARATINTGVGTELPVATGDKKGFAYVAYADPEFLDVFSLPFLAGDSRNALRSPQSAVISSDTALRFFGGPTQSLGRHLRLQDGTDLTIRGVVGQLGKPSHISTTGDDATPFVRFDVLVSMDVLERSLRRKGGQTWDNSPPVFTYAVLPKDGSLSLQAFSDRLKSFGARHADSDGNTYTFGTQSVSDLWLGGMGSLVGTDKSGPIVMFYFLGAIVLLISCLNYANLATAQATTRAKEIGMRRAMGAYRGQIIWQFMVEAALLALFALICATVLILISLVAFKIPGSAFVLKSVATTAGFWIFLVGLLTAVTLGAGSYPAFVLSSVQPLRAVRAGQQRTGGRLVSRLLVGLQFAGASFLLISMLVMMKQNETLRHTAMSGSGDAFVSIANDIHAAGVEFETLSTEMLRQPHIKDVTASVVSPWLMIALASPVTDKADDNAIAISAVLPNVNYNFFSTLGIKLLAGRVFERGSADDSSEIEPSSSDARAANVVIDQALAERFGWSDPNEAIGKTLYVPERGSGSAPRANQHARTTKTVIGVVENHPMGVMSPDGAKSTMYLLTPNAAVYPIVRISGADAAAAISEIDRVWAQLAPSIALKTRFADELMERNYRSAQTITLSFRFVATLALLISVLGLVGMSFHVIGRRRHEIGVRKTLGASVGSVLRLLLADFSRPVAIANLLAWPLGFLAMRGYLNMFSNQIDLSIAPFATSLAITLLIAWAAVVGQATRAARLNPATVLRVE